MKGYKMVIFKTRETQCSLDNPTTKGRFSCCADASICSTCTDVPQTPENQCQIWSDSGFCADGHKFKSYMRQNCARTCGFDCTITDTTATTTTQTTISVSTTATSKTTDKCGAGLFLGNYCDHPILGPLVSGECPELCNSISDGGDECSVQHSVVRFDGPYATTGNGNGIGASTARVAVKPAYADFGPQTFGAGVLDGNGASVAHNVGIADPPMGCAPFRNAGVVRGNVALVIRGGCKFWEKTLYAQQAGATHLIILNIPGVDMVTRMVCPEIGKGDSIALDGVNYECSTGITIPTFAIDYDVGTRLSTTANDTDASGELNFSCVPPEEEEEEVGGDEGGGETNEEDEVENEEDDGDNNNNANKDNGVGGGSRGKDEGSSTTAENANNLCNNQADQMGICQPHLQQYCTDSEYGDSLSKGCPVLCNSCPPTTRTPSETTTTEALFEYNDGDGDGGLSGDFSDRDGGDLDEAGLVGDNNQTDLLTGVGDDEGMVGGVRIISSLLHPPPTLHVLYTVNHLR